MAPFDIQLARASCNFLQRTVCHCPHFCPLTLWLVALVTLATRLTCVASVTCVARVTFKIDTVVGKMILCSGKMEGGSLCGPNFHHQVASMDQVAIVATIVSQLC
jgi:hypothetical protein